MELLAGVACGALMGMLFLGVAALALPAFGSGGQPADGSRESFGWMPFAAAGALGGWMALGVLCGLAYSLLDRASDAGWLLYAGGGLIAALGVAKLRKGKKGK